MLERYPITLVLHALGSARFISDIPRSSSGRMSDERGEENAEWNRDPPERRPGFEVAWDSVSGCAAVLRAARRHPTLTWTSQGGVVAIALVVVAFGRGGRITDLIRDLNQSEKEARYSLVPGRLNITVPK